MCYFNNWDIDGWDFISDMRKNGYNIYDVYEMELYMIMFDFSWGFGYFIVKEDLFKNMIGWKYFLLVICIGICFL